MIEQEPKDIAGGLLWWYVHSEREPDYYGLEKAIETALKEAAFEAVQVYIEDDQKAEGLLKEAIRYAKTCDKHL